MGNSGAFYGLPELLLGHPCLPDHASHIVCPHLAVMTVKRDDVPRTVAGGCPLHMTRARGARLFCEAEELQGTLHRAARQRAVRHGGLLDRWDEGKGFDEPTNGRYVPKLHAA